MAGLRIGIIWLALGLSLAACSQPVASDRTALVVDVRGTSESECSVTIGGKVFVMPRDGDMIAEAFTVERPKGAAVQIKGYGSAPYRCVGSAAFLAQKAGFEELTFTQVSSTGRK